MDDRTISQWDVPSDSNPNRKYKVSLVRILLTSEKEYQCSCVGWTNHMPRKHCKHIRAVLDGDLDINRNADFEVLPGNVGQVTVQADNTVLAPLIPFGGEGTGLLATIVYDLLELGMPMKKIRERFRMIPKEWTTAGVMAYIETRGRYVYTKWVKGIGWTEPKWIYLTR